MTPLKKSVRRLTIGTLDHHHGSDRGKRLVASLEQGDLLTLKPHKTRRPETVSLFDVYSWAIRCRVNRSQLERARERKALLVGRRREAAFRRSVRRGKI